MRSTEIHGYGRKLSHAHGEKAELETAQKTRRYKDEGNQLHTGDWNRIRTAIREIRSPHEN